MFSAVLCRHNKPRAVCHVIFVLISIYYHRDTYRPALPHHLTARGRLHSAREPWHTSRDGVRYTRTFVVWLRVYRSVRDILHDAVGYSRGRMAGLCGVTSGFKALTCVALWNCFFSPATDILRLAPAAFIPPQFALINDDFEAQW